MGMRIVAEGWMPEARVERVITHWTAGQHHASSTDREHYHLLIEGDGRLVRGDHSIDDNDSTGDGDYAPHTRGCNTGSIGVALCCMAGAMAEPFRPGSAPMTREQYEALSLVCADLCERYGLAVSPETVLGHGEVERILRKPQRGKWDPMVLPWDPHRPGQTVGLEFRSRVSAHLAAPSGSDPESGSELRSVRVVVDGREITDEAVVLDGTTWLPLRPLAQARQWSVLEFGDRRASVQLTRERRISLAGQVRGDRGYVCLGELCMAVGWPAPEWDGKRRTASVRVNV